MPSQVNTPNNLDGFQANLYQNGQGITNEYVFDPGVCVLPIAEDAPTDINQLKTWSPVVVLRLHAPYRIRKVNYSATKQNNPPILPSPKDVGAFVFVAGSVQLQNGLNSSYFNFDWQATAQYMFIENCVSRVEDGLVLGAPPWVWQTDTLNELNAPPTNNNGIGAIAQAGTAPQVGLSVANNISFNSLGGYLYNLPEYYPGVFFNDYLANGIPMQQTHYSQHS